MAGKSALPILAAAGLAAVFLSKKKKKTDDSGGSSSKDDKFPIWTQKSGEGLGNLEISPDGNAKMVFDESCQAFADKLNADAHNTYITGAFHAMVDAGVKNAEEIVQAMLRDQASQCPWDKPDSYTDLMRGVHDQLLEAVRGYAAQNNIALS